MSEFGDAFLKARDGVPKNDIHEFKSGAKSSGMMMRYDLIPLWALNRIARRFEMGSAKYGEGNWMKGAQDRDFILDRINHAIAHLYILSEQVRKGGWSPNWDDDAAAVILNSIFVMGWQRTQDEHE